MNKKLWSAFVFIYFILSFSSYSLAQTKDDSDDFYDRVDLLKDGLNGGILSSIKDLRVGISLENTPLLKGLVETQIKTDVENRLKRAGFNLTTEDNPYLFIYIASTYSGNKIDSFSIQLTYYEEVLLERDKTKSYSDDIWSRGLEIKANQIEENTIKNSVLNLIDKFIEICRKSREAKNNRSSTSDNKKTSPTDLSKSKKNDDSPFTATYVGGNSPPEVEIVNDSDRTLYIDLGQGKITAYTIPSKTSLKINLEEGNYDFKAIAPSVLPLQGQQSFRKGYRYVWRFTVIKR